MDFDGNSGGMKMGFNWRVGGFAALVFQGNWQTNGLVATLNGNMKANNSVRNQSTNRISFKHVVFSFWGVAFRFEDCKDASYHAAPCW